MSEFAFSGLGLNPHYGTPTTPFDGTRIAGGSSSGAAVSVALDMAVAGLGTDTGGSIRIPSAFCGLTGFKPSANRVPMGGVFPLARSLDSVGALARSVDECVLLDAILSGEVPDHHELPLAGLQLAVTRDYVLEGLDAVTELAFEAALKRLVDAGAQLRWFDFPELHELPQINAAGGLVAAQAWHLHREWLQGPEATAYDPLVAQRIRRGEVLSAYDYLELERQRQRLIEIAHRRLAGTDAWLLPTVAMVAPPLSELQNDEATFFRVNAKVLRNPSVINFLDGCALSSTFALTRRRVASSFCNSLRGGATIATGCNDQASVPAGVGERSRSGAGAAFPVQGSHTRSALRRETDPLCHQRVRAQRWPSGPCRRSRCKCQSLCSETAPPGRRLSAAVREALENQTSAAVHRHRPGVSGQLRTLAR